MPNPDIQSVLFTWSFLTCSLLSHSAHAVLSPPKQRIGLSYYAMSCLFNSLSTTSGSIDPRQCRPELANTLHFHLSPLFLGGVRSHPYTKVVEENSASDLCAGSWLESPGLTAVNSMTQKTSQQLMPPIKSDSPAEQAGSGHGWGLCVPAIKRTASP